MSSTYSEPQTVQFHGVDDLVLVADEWNRGAPSAADRPTVLMLHGGGQNRFSWKNTCQVLARHGSDLQTHGGLNYRELRSRLLLIPPHSLLASPCKG